MPTLLFRSERASLTAENALLQASLHHALLSCAVPLLLHLVLVLLLSAVLHEPVTIGPAHSNLLDPIQADSRIREIAQALKGASLPKPGLVVIAVHLQHPIRSIDRLAPKLQLDCCLREVPEHSTVQLENHRVLIGTPPRSTELPQRVVPLPPAGDSLLPVASLPLHKAIFLALLPKVEGHLQALHVDENPASLLLFPLLLLLHGLIRPLNHGIHLILQELSFCITTLVKPLSGRVELTHGVRPPHELNERYSRLLGLVVHAQ
mmetsp:Transcript_513/g.1623  ORF Transcript_513/g.1623 Transcript_513/m.1623 type:complete len:263 (-) Transcript_513:591-1379(-)